MNMPWVTMMNLITRNKALSVIGWVVAAIHLCLVSAILLVFPSSGQTAIGLLLLLWVLDWFVAPVSMFLANITQYNVAAYMVALIVIHGILGTIGWFFTPILMGMAIKKFMLWIQTGRIKKTSG